MSATKLTVAGAVVLARRRFLGTFVQNGSGWFPSQQAAEDLFDLLILQGAFSDMWLMKTAQRENEENGFFTEGDAP